MSKKKDPKQKASPKPKFSVVTPFPEDRVVRDREIENLIRRLRRAKLKEVVILGCDEDGMFWQSTNGIDRVDALWFLEMARLDLFNLLERK